MDWDKKGYVSATAIATPDENEYVIDSHDKGEELLGLLQEEVEVSGELRKKGNKKIIKVKKYKKG